MLEKMVIKNKDGVYALPIRKIVYMEKNLRKILVHTEGDVNIEFYGRFTDIDDFLDDRFMQCHRSYVINMDRISAMGDGQISFEDSKEPIYLGRDTFVKAKKAFDAYMHKKKDPPN